MASGICNADPATLSWLTQAQCGMVSFWDTIGGTAQGVAEEGQKTVTGVAAEGSKVGVAGAKAIETAAPYAAGAAGFGASLAAFGLPTLLVFGTVGVALADQVVTGGKGRKALVKAVL